MNVREITPAVDAATMLAGAQFADAFQIEIRDHELDARRAAERMMARQPRWAEALLSVRNLLVAPLGLKTSGANPDVPRDMIGIFPVVSETPDRLIAGFNDRHLDFRVVVDVTPPGGVRQVTATTLVLTHNWLGRAYLKIIMPFHRLIVPALLHQVVAGSLDRISRSGASKAGV
ncbi:DUF2867 domain-containing protein [Bradyrhizobium sp. LMTR 3]|uniref:DUF2867 domain-containing protein n=1 Tax=Bradyrhizobium sp. LMTR 3 TaxID=189873 RepID=UPI000810377A|nr:DUF2867 domain-containing protein [Bradyrhizobium sp. LMTR 3]OCK57800.1 hypothetical protein LMTR3_01475 [Bradyrhizobium sp. LMTR 3]